MNFQAAYNYMKRGHKVRLPEWGGFWIWDSNLETIMIHTRDGRTFDFRKTEDVDYTISFLFRQDFELVDDFIETEEKIEYR